MQSNLWWQTDQDKAAGPVASVVDQLEKDQQNRSTNAAMMLSTYEAKEVQSVDSRPYTNDSRRTNLPWPLARSICDTAAVKVYSRSRPRPKFTTNGGDYRDRQRAKGLEKYIEAQYMQPYGMHENLWELTEAVGKDAVKVGVGAVKVFAGPTRLEIERVNYLSLYVDEMEATSGHVLNMFHRYAYPKSKLAARFPKLEADIYAAPNYTPKNQSETGSQHDARSADLVEVTEAWHLPTGVYATESKEAPKTDEGARDAMMQKGRHVMILSGTGGRTEGSAGYATSTKKSIAKCLCDEEWDRAGFPFAILRWEPHSSGFWASGLCYVLENMQEGLHRTTKDLRQNAELNCSGVFMCPEGTELKDFESNEYWKPVPYTGPTAPTALIPPPFNPAHLDWALQQKAVAYELSGVNQSSATGRKEAGVTAAVAMREMNDMESERLKPYAVRYENFHVAIGRLAVAATSEMSKQKGNTAFKLWDGRNFLRGIAFSDISLSEDKFTTSVYAASSMPSTPFAKKQSIQEDFETELIDAEERKRRMKELDLENYADLDNAQHDLVDRLVGRFLFAKDDKQLKELGGYVGPDEAYTDFSRAIAQVRKVLLQELVDGIPDYNAKLLRRFIADTDDLAIRVESAQKLKVMEEMERQAADKQKQQAPQSPPGASPPVPPGMGSQPGLLPGGPPGPAPLRGAGVAAA